MKTPIIKKATDAVLLAYGSFVFNGLYSIYNFLLGIFAESWAFIILSAYYLLLGLLRFRVLLSLRRTGENSPVQISLIKFTGIVFLVLALTISIVTDIPALSMTGQKYHEFIMISIAVYTAIKMILAILNLINARRKQALFMTTLRGISLADALVSLVALQQSLFLTFEGISDREEYFLNMILGTVISVLLLGLGLFLIFVGIHYAKKKEQ